MVRFFIVISLLLAVMGCQTKEKIKEVYVDVPVPVYTVPMPPEVPLPNFYEPKLDGDVSQLSDDELKEFIGELSKAYYINLRNMKKYSQAVTLILEKYREIANYGDEKLEDLRMSNVDDRTKLEQFLGDQSINPRTYRDQLPLGGSEISEGHWDFDYQQWLVHFETKEEFEKYREQFSEDMYLDEDGE